MLLDSGLSTHSIMMSTSAREYAGQLIASQAIILGLWGKWSMRGVRPYGQHVPFPHIHQGRACLILTGRVDRIEAAHERVSIAARRAHQPEPNRMRDVGRGLHFCNFPQFSDVAALALMGTRRRTQFSNTYCTISATSWATSSRHSNNSSSCICNSG